MPSDDGDDDDDDGDDGDDNGDDDNGTWCVVKLYAGPRTAHPPPPHFSEDDQISHDLSWSPNSIYLQET